MAIETGTAAVGSRTPDAGRPRPGSGAGVWLVLMIVDLAGMLLASLIAVAGRNNLGIFRAVPDWDPNLPTVACAVGGLWLVGLYLVGAYQVRLIGAGPAEYTSVIRGSLVTAAVVGIATFLTRYPLSRGYYVLLFGVGVSALILGRRFVHGVLHILHRRGLMMTTFLVAGNVAAIDALTARLRADRRLGYAVVGALPSDSTGVETPLGLPTFGSPSDAVFALRQTGANGVIFADGSFSRPQRFQHMARALEREHARMIVVPELADSYEQRLVARPVSGAALVQLRLPWALQRGRRSKRLFDTVASLALLVLLSPVMAITVLLVRSAGADRAFRREERLGRHGRAFGRLGLCPPPDAAGPWARGLGAFLHRHGLDALPQLVNVLVGDLSLVGPCPVPPGHAHQGRHDLSRRFAVRPGMTGLWLVAGKADLTWQDTVRFDLHYVDHWSIVQDIQILSATALAVLLGRVR